MCKMILKLICCVAILTLSFSIVIDESFDLWKREYGVTYTLDEELVRKSAWHANLQIVDTINSNNLGWHAKMTRFADMTSQEFGRLLPSLGNVEFPFSTTKISPKSRKSAASSLDWRNNGLVTSVKDQGFVGSCWAFSTVGNIEGQWARAGHSLTDLSPEFLVDCDGSHDDKHADCSVFGGWPYLAYDYIIKAGGIPSEATWPYCSGTGDCYPCMQGPVSLCGPPPYTCDRNITLQCPKATVAAVISHWAAVQQDDTLVAESLEEVGPLSALLDATQLQFYDSGVWNGRTSGSPAILGCSDTYINHAVLIVGFGEDASTSNSSTAVPYWTVKNSWGAGWGEAGYFRIARQPGPGKGTCGINTGVTSALI